MINKMGVITIKNIKKKRSKKIIPVVIAIIVVISIALIQPIRSIMAMSSMSPLVSKEVMPDIYSIDNIFVNLYLFKSGDKYIAFDGGADKEATKSAMQNLNIDADDIIAVFLTHTDYDHVAAIPLFSSAEIYMAKSNETFLTENQSRSKSFINMDENFKTLDDGENINIEDVQIQCLFTPGHTNGSASYIVNGKYLFVGDTLSLKDGKVSLFNSIFNMNNDIQNESINRLSKLNGIVAIFTMHYGYTDSIEANFDEWQVK